jgi:hypothetical protein
MKRRRAGWLAAATAVGAATALLLSAGDAVGKQSEPKPKPSERIEICHEGKTRKIYLDELDEHILHGDIPGRCLKNKDE